MDKGTKEGRNVSVVGDNGADGEMVGEVSVRLTRYGRGEE